ncbi:hypothetical protein SAMN05216360_13714 [Methylobacterium phyllostachyos]|uniref:Uncharacterized protein n=1 Tax=Methylobacterium phyllostachyos TaxID=582672 RepID=A0A1H0LLC4_9HYPH|nr:hypothetical protein [Methylobacterium phyllostachyos]SDO68885.1 hypothetical protein SAMN05216360_13714 [Methylobacterium phyllostachyos]
MSRAGLPCCGSAAVCTQRLWKALGCTDDAARLSHAVEAIDRGDTVVRRLAAA